MNKNNEIMKTYLLNEEINCILPNRMHTLAYLTIDENEIVLKKKSLLLDVLIGILSFEDSYKKIGSKKEIAKINLSDVKAIERKRAGLNKNAFYVSVNYGTEYCFIFNEPRSVYFKLRKILPSITFTNFDNFNND